MNKFFLEVLHEEAIPEMSLSELLGGEGGKECDCNLTFCNSYNPGCFGYSPGGSCLKNYFG